MSIPAKDTHLAALNHYLRAVAIVFDFVNPVLALWRLIDRRTKLGFDGGLCETFRNTLKEEAPDDHCQGFFPLQEGETVMAGNHHQRLTTTERRSKEQAWRFKGCFSKQPEMSHAR
jgi:hypothetical protein